VISAPGINNHIKQTIKFGAISRSLKVLKKSDLRKVFLAAFLQGCMNILDLVGVATIGILGALTVRGVQAQEPGDRISGILNFLQIGNWSFQSQAAALAIFATLTLILRTIFSLIFSRRLLRFLSRCSSDLANDILFKYLNQNLLELRKKSPQDLLYSIQVGTDSITIRLIGNAIVFVSDFLLLLLLGLGLFLVSPLVAFISIIGFGSVGAILYLRMRKAALELSLENANLRISSSEKFMETVSSIRELRVQNKVWYFANDLAQSRSKVAYSSAELTFLPTVSKYVLESAVVLGTLIIGCIQFLMEDAYHAAAILAVFLAAGSRIAPAILRLQQSAVQIKSSSGEGMPTLDIVEGFSGKSTLQSQQGVTRFSYPSFTPSVSLHNVEFKFSDEDASLFENVSLRIEPRSSVAIVGPSGAGKTTLVDLILGLVEPTAGSVLISDMEPIEAIRHHSGAISYVPQDTFVGSGSILDNVAFGYGLEVRSRARVIEAIDAAGLGDFTSNLELGIDTTLGPNGINLSGGQRQRLGIARALYSNPSLLVLDEATSALDASTELAISESLAALKSKVTVISIAHRLSTVRKADLVVYLDKGRILAQGTFDEVRAQVKDFDANAKLLGL
jgi:ABC-type bacteriocin/lantibiotic exporter with double-glycine peptidase domain